MSYTPCNTRERHDAAETRQPSARENSQGRGTPVGRPRGTRAYLAVRGPRCGNHHADRVQALSQQARTAGGLGAALQGRDERILLFRFAPRGRISEVRDLRRGKSAQIRFALAHLDRDLSSAGAEALAGLVSDSTGPALRRQAGGLRGRFLRGLPHLPRSGDTVDGFRGRRSSFGGAEALSPHWRQIARKHRPFPEVTCPASPPLP